MTRVIWAFILRTPRAYLSFGRRQALSGEQSLWIVLTAHMLIRYPNTGMTKGWQ